MFPHIDELARLLNQDQLVLFVGAGLSYQAIHKTGNNLRLPLWKDLAQRVAEHCGHQNRENNDLLDLFDSIATNMSRGRLEEAVRHAIPSDEFAPSDAHRELSKICWNIIVTTNYDNLLSECLSEKSPIVTEPNYEWLSRSDTERPKLVHIHGTLSNPHTLTGSDYAQWDEQHPLAYNFLKTLRQQKLFYL